MNSAANWSVSHGSLFIMKGKVKVVAVAEDRASYLCPTMKLRSQPQTYRDGRPSDDEDMGVPLAEEVQM